MPTQMKMPPTTLCDPPESGHTFNSMSIEDARTRRQRRHSLGIYSDQFKYTPGGTPRQEDDGNPYPSTSNVGRLRSICRQATSDFTSLFTSPDGVPFAMVKEAPDKDNIVRTTLYDLGDEAFKLWLTDALHEQYHVIPSNDELERVTRLLKARARKSRTETPVRRIAMRRKPVEEVRDDEGNITGFIKAETLFLDLCDEGGHVVKITAEGWEVIQPHHVPYGKDCFREEPPFCDLPWLRDGSMDALPIPTELQPGQAAQVIDEWMQMLPPSVGQHERVVLLTWLLSAFNPNGPYCLLVIRGPRGAGKSNLLDMLQRAIDPSTATERAKLPKKTDDLITSAQGRHCLAFDNVSGTLSTETSDDLCRLLTGGSMSSRTFYQQRRATSVRAKRPILLDGIDSSIVASDLHRRTLKVTLKKLRDNQGRLEEDVQADYESLRPWLMGALADALVATMRARKERRRYADLPSMRDASSFAIPALDVLGYSEAMVRAALQENEQEGLDTAFDASPFAVTLVHVMEDKPAVWDATPAEILRALNFFVRNDPQVQRETWPRNPNQVGTWLTRDEDVLLAYGIAWQQLPRQGRKGRRFRLTRVSPTTPPDGVGVSASDETDTKTDTTTNAGTAWTDADVVSQCRSFSQLKKVEGEEERGDSGTAAAQVVTRKSILHEMPTPPTPSAASSDEFRAESGVGGGVGLGETDTIMTQADTIPPGELVGPRIIRDGVTRRRGTDGRWHVVAEVSK